MFCRGCWSLIALALALILTGVIIALKRRHIIILIIHLRKRRLQSELNHTLKTETETLIAEVLHTQQNTGEGRAVDLN